MKGALPEDALPERAQVLRTIDGDYLRHVLAEVDGVLLMLRIWKSDAEVWTSGPDADQARKIADEVVRRVPCVEDAARVPVFFSDAHTGTRKLDLLTRPWSDVRDLYPASVAAALDELVQHKAVVDESRRVILWHGAPGTGKTTAVRALLQAWRGWADGMVVSDPEDLLKDGRYLRRLLLDAGDDEARWQLIILEDAESLLRKDGASSAAMAKLLNLADGLLGQGLRCLFLLTTNEPLTAIHPALVRPGRCLAQIEFGPLSATHAGAVLGTPVDRDMTLAEVIAIRPVSVQATPVRVGQYL